MSKTSVEIAESYYLAMQKKDVVAAAHYLHPDVQLIGPLGDMQGKETVLAGAKRFTSVYRSLTIRAKFGLGDQAMIVYDLDCPAPIGALRAAVLMKIHAGLIERMELFYDARPFEK